MMGNGSGFGSRRAWLRTTATWGGMVAAGAATALPWSLARAQGARELRIGYQKSASMFVLQRAQGTLEKRVAPLGATVKWVEFPAGPQLLEGLNVGAIDVGFTGEAPPVFAQAAGARFNYVGNDPPAPEAEAIVVPKASNVKTFAELKGKRIALNKGSNVHYLLVKLLEKSGMKYADFEPVYLPPADARAAFERGAVDAWVIWDPFLAAAEKQLGARRLADGTGLVDNYQFYLAETGWLKANGDVLKALFDDLRTQSTWVLAHVHDAAAIIAPIQGLDADVVEASLRRYRFGVAPLTPTVIAAQQKVADAFFDLQLIPKQIHVADAVGAVVATK